MNKTSIEWCDLSVNPLRARKIDGSNRVPGHFCQKISPGCANCYSSGFQPRFGMSQFPGITKGPDDLGEEVYLDEEVLASVLRRKKPATIFWCDMTDLFGSWVPFEWIDKCFAIMAMTPHLTHIVLTKRAQRMAEYFNGTRRDGFTRGYIALHYGRPGRCFPRIWKPGLMPYEQNEHKMPWPLPNVWLGVSAEDQPRLDERIPLLLQSPAAVRFLSCEPLLGPVDLLRVRNWQHGESFATRSALHATDGLNLGREIPGRDQRIDWVICGGESGSGARPMHPAWVRSLRDQCFRAGVAFFFKQWGAWEGADGGDPRNGWQTIGISGRLLPMMPGPESRDEEPRAVVRLVGKGAAGRLLDGQEWSEFPHRLSQETSHA